MDYIKIVEDKFASRAGAIECLAIESREEAEEIHFLYIYYYLKNREICIFFNVISNHLLCNGSEGRPS